MPAQPLPRPRPGAGCGARRRFGVLRPHARGVDGDLPRPHPRGPGAPLRDPRRRQDPGLEVAALDGRARDPPPRPDLPHAWAAGRPHAAALRADVGGGAGAERGGLVEAPDWPRRPGSGGGPGATIATGMLPGTAGYRTGKLRPRFHHCASARNAPRSPGWGRGSGWAGRREVSSDLARRRHAAGTALAKRLYRLISLYVGAEMRNGGRCMSSVLAKRLSLILAAAFLSSHSAS